MERITIDDKIELKWLRTSLAGELNRLINANKDHLHPWMDWTEKHPEVSDTEKWIASWRTGGIYDGDSVWAIMFEGQLAGTIGLHRGIAYCRHLEIGYWLGRSFTGKGLVTKSVAGLMDFLIAEFNVNRFMIRSAVENTGSTAVAERLGFELIGVMPDDTQVAGRLMDANVHIMLQRDWKKGKP